MTTNDIGVKSGYICIGSVRGACSHIHQTVETAMACLERDQTGCAGQGGYSDRRIVRVDEDYTYEPDGEGGERETSDVCFSRIRGYYIAGGN